VRTGTLFIPGPAAVGIEIGHDAQRERIWRIGVLMNLATDDPEALVHQMRQAVHDETNTITLFLLSDFCLKLHIAVQESLSAIGGRSPKGHGSD
jgi:hypothetical protein